MNFIVLYQRIQKKSKTKSKFGYKTGKNQEYCIPKQKNNYSQQNKQKNGKVQYIDYWHDRNKKRKQTVNISSHFIDYQLVQLLIILIREFLQVTTINNTMSANISCDKMTHKKNNQFQGIPLLKNPGPNLNFSKRPNSSYKIQAQQLMALKQRVKVRNTNKQNNPLYQSQNLFAIGNMKRTLDQPIKEENQIHLREKQVQELSINDFQIGDLLGRGAEARVRIAFHKPTGSVFSIKTLLRRKVQQKMEIFIRSLKIQMFLDHPNITKIYGIIIEQKEVHLIMEYCADGDFSMNRNMFGKQNKNIKSILYKISQAVYHLHSNRIQHRDLKLQNILLNYGVPKITDFQLSVYTRLDFFPRRTICGTPAYYSPEMVGKHKYNKKADIWCLGIIFYELLCGYFPFEYKNMQDLQNISGKQLKQFPRTLSRMATELINKMLTKQSQNRISIQGILMHEFFLIQKKQCKESKQ